MKVRQIGPPGRCPFGVHSHLPEIRAVLGVGPSTLQMSVEVCPMRDGLRGGGEGECVRAGPRGDSVICREGHGLRRLAGDHHRDMGAP
jgi:hypothetical protein